ncbi:twin-arginine translocase TatA/TatE family subunit [Rhodanobacter ginsenosidimutans]|jgi:sec-independent protein translocase protein TatA|uniref:Sec-independent protein translocase protein TatA n=1 Tax=Rhodanobacter ginsenosidimutans TaxID=490571 RepID=A0ABW0JXD6_9GAMM
MLGLNSFSHWIVLLALVLLLFGTGRLRNAGRDLGGAIAGFRRGLKSDASGDAAEQPASPKDPR